MLCDDHMRKCKCLNNTGHNDRLIQRWMDVETDKTNYNTRAKSSTTALYSLFINLKLPQEKKVLYMRNTTFLGNFEVIWYFHVLLTINLPPFLTTT